MFNLLRRKRKPTRLELNDMVREVLAEKADDGTKVRHVRHFVYPIQVKSILRPDMQRVLSQFGDFDFVDAPESGIVIEHYNEVASKKFDELTLALTKACAENSWEYDGWECGVTEAPGM